MGDIVECIAPMAQSLRSDEPLTMADRNLIALWLETLASGYEDLESRLSTLESTDD